MELKKVVVPVNSYLTTNFPFELYTISYVPDIQKLSPSYTTNVYPA